MCKLMQIRNKEANIEKSMADKSKPDHFLTHVEQDLSQKKNNKKLREILWVGTSNKSSIVCL